MSTNLRDQMAKNSRGKLLCEWTADKETYRLITIGRYTAGYEDRYVIEKLGADAIGEPQWTAEHAWEPGDNVPAALLVQVIKAHVGDKTPMPTAEVTW